MKLVSVITPCFNEEENIENMYHAVKNIFENIKTYRYEHIFIDNASTDNSKLVLKAIAKLDTNVKVIINSRNFGWMRSPYHALLQATGDATIMLAADFQDPPSLIPNFLKKWEEGFKIVVGVKNKSDESKIVFFIRKLYYRLLKKFSDIDIISNFTGFGLYDRTVLDTIRQFKDTYPFLRGIIAEVGLKPAKVDYCQPLRKKGKKSSTFYNLYDIGMQGIVNHSKIPLRLITFSGFILSILSFAIASIYLLLKLIFWKKFYLGLAPILIGCFFFFSFQMLLIGVLGEYILAIYTQVLKRPLVIEKERINFTERTSVVSEVHHYEQ